MQINDIVNKDEFVTVVINELKQIGVKYRKEKKDKKIQETACRKRIFHTHLNFLELSDVIIANGNVVQIPKFVADASNRIFEQIETEGIFRKAGSNLRQKEIRMSLESGVPLGRSHHVIDVANLLKYFFRELPEPLIPPIMQETFIRSMLIGANNIQAIFLTCLLLPPLTLNTLTFFMQFLHSVTLHAHANKMTAENLAIIFTPGLMPFANIASLRFANHMKLVRLLIENANGIGTIPDSVTDKLQIKSQLSNDTPSQSCNVLENTQKKKKKRRSGSLSQMFNGLRKIVGSAIGSSENLENMPDAVPTDALAADKQNCLPPATTPCLKATKKRKFTDPVCAFSAKKKRDLLALLPSNSGGLLPNTPLTKESKKARVSLGGNRHIKKITINPVVTSIERRWSIVGTGWSKQKIKNNTESMKKNQMKLNELDIPELNTTDEMLDCNEYSSAPKIETANTNCMQITKNEYDAIKERVDAIESRISQEFGAITKSYLNENCMSGPERVLNKYEKMIVETEGLSSPTTEKLAQRLGRGLNIRRSTDQRVVRSPSARKIGTMRRRSQEKVRLSRTQTWHHNSVLTNMKQVPQEPLLDSTGPTSFYAKSSLKSGRSKNLLKDLTSTDAAATNLSSEKIAANEQWTSAELFFNDIQHESSAHCFQTPAKKNITKSKILQNDTVQTPMLPPKSVPRKNVTKRTPNSAMKLSVLNKCAVATPSDADVNGRASIARLRTANAGMVMAKAKLFDGLNTDVEFKPQQLQSKNDECSDRRKSLRGATANVINLNNKNLEKLEKLTLKNVSVSPRRPPIEVKQYKNSPSCVKKRQRISKYGGCKQALRNTDQTLQIRNNKTSLHNIRNIKDKDAASPKTTNLRYRMKTNSPRRINKQFAGNELYEIYSPAKKQSIKPR